MTEPAVGVVTGTILRQDGLPLESATVYVRSGERTRQTKTDAYGRFRLQRIHAGKVEVSMASSGHQIEDRVTYVTETRVTNLVLKATRNQPNIAISTNGSTMFMSTEPVRIRVRGYADSPFIQLRLWKLNVKGILTSERALNALSTMKESYADVVSKVPASFGALGKPSHLTKFALGKPDRDGFFVKKLAIDYLRGNRGLWLVGVTAGKLSSYSWVVISDLAMVLKRPMENRNKSNSGSSAPDSLIYAVNQQTGAPIKGVRVARYTIGQAQQTRVVTGSTGTAWLKPFIKGADVHESYVGTHGDDIAFVTHKSTQAAAADDSLVVDLQTDRPIYRPGHTVQFKGTVRQHNMAVDSHRYTVPVGQPVNVALFDAYGAEIGRKKCLTSALGTFFGAFKTSKEVGTGSFNLEAKAGGTQTSTSVRVASYRKQEVEVSVVPAQRDALYGDTVEVTVGAALYHGRPLDRAKVEWTVYSQPDWKSEIASPEVADAMEESEALRPNSGEYGSLVAEGTGTLSETGKLVLRFPAKHDAGIADKTPEEDRTFAQVETYTVSAFITDTSGRSVSGSGTFRVTTAEQTVALTADGYLAESGKKHSVVATVRDKTGKLAVGAKVSLFTYRIKSLRVASDETDDTSEYGVERTEKIPVGQKQTGITEANGQVGFTITPDQPGRLECMAEVITASGKIARSTESLFVVSPNEQNGGLDESVFTNELTLSTDQVLYTDGQTARVMIGTRRLGQTVLLTIEGERVHKVISVPIRTTCTLISIPLPHKYGPNVLLSACYIRKKQFASADTVVRVKMPERELKIGIDVSKIAAAPGELVPVSIVIKDRFGKPVKAEFSVAVVDEALHALASDDPKMLFRTFYPLRYNSIITKSSFDVVYLGGDEKGGPIVTPRKRFLDTAWWKPDGVTDAQGRAALRIPMPDNLTRWRITVRATTLSNTQVGFAKASITVTKPFSVRLDVPRAFGTADRSRVLAIVTNATGLPQDVWVRLPVAGTLGGGNEVRKIRIPAGTSGSAEWNLNLEQASMLTLQCTAWTADNKYTDGVLVTVPVRAFGRQSLWSDAGSLNARTRVLQVNVPSNDLPQERKLTITVAPGVASTVRDALEFLAQYPYGCTEQTMSRIAPRVRMAKANPDVFSRVERMELDQAVIDGVTRLRRMQHYQAGWGWWEGGTDDPFLTAYVLHGLLDLRDAGVKIPEDMLKSGANALAELNNAKVPIGVFGHWAAVRAGVPLLKEPPSSSKMETIDLAWAVLWAKAKGLNTNLWIAPLKNRAKREGPLIYWQNGKSGQWDPNSSTRMTTAVALRALLATSPKDDLVSGALRWLVTSKDGASYGDTRDTAYVLNALSDWMIINPLLVQEPTRMAVTVNGKPVVVEGTRGTRTIRVPQRLLKSGKNNVTLSVDGVNPEVVYWTAALSTVVAPKNNLQLPPIAPSGIMVGQEYITAQHVSDIFKTGDGVEVRVTVDTPRVLHHVMLAVALPAGFEPTELGTVDRDGEGESDGGLADQVDVRDDRVALFFQRIEKGKHVFTVHVRAQTPGKFLIPPATLTPMYYSKLRAESRSGAVEVRR